MVFFCYIGFLHDVVSGCFCCSLLLACDLLSNLPGQKRTDNGYSGKSIVKHEMDICRNEVNIGEPSRE